MQYAAAVLYVISALGQGWALFEIWRQSNRATVMLQDPDFVNRVGYDGGIDFDGPFDDPHRNDPEVQAVYSLAVNQRSTSMAMVALAVALVAGVLASFLTL